MKNRSGFTLIELLAVIAILALLGSIIVPIINRDVSRSRQSLYDQQLKNIREAARQYGANHLGELPTSESEDAVTIKLQKLIDEGYISDSVMNPKTKKPFSNDTDIVISYHEGKLVYTITVKE